jgi:hypothetical protein
LLDAGSIEPSVSPITCAVAEKETTATQSSLLRVSITYIAAFFKRYSLGLTIEFDISTTKMTFFGAEVAATYQGQF